MMRLLCGALLLVTAGAVDAGPPKEVMIGGHKIKAEDILDGKVTLDSGDFTIGCVQGKTDDVMKDMETELNWKPQTRYETMPMMIGTLTPVDILWLLKQKDVTFIDPVNEADVGLEDEEGTKEKGVRIGGTLYTEQEIKDGKVEVKPGNFIVGVDGSKKEQILKDMATELKWKPTLEFSERLALFAGPLTKDQILWLLGNGGVLYIEEDIAATIADQDSGKGKDSGVVTITDGENFDKGNLETAGPSLHEGAETDGLPKGVSIDGVLHPTADIEKGTYELHPGKFVVGVEKGKKAEVLKEMEDKYKWTPENEYSSSMPMFSGTLHQDQILGLLGMKEVRYIENDGVVHVENRTGDEEQNKTGGEEPESGEKKGHAERLAPLLPLMASVAALALFVP